MSDAEALRVLYETTRQIGLEEDLDALLDEILQRARDLIGFDHCGLLLREPQSGALVLRRVVGFGEHLLGLQLEKGDGLCGLAAERRVAIREGNVPGCKRYVPGLEEAQSDMAVPLIVQNRVVGILNVESRRRDAFSEEHEMLLTVLGTQAALAIVASETQRVLREKLDRLDALYRVSTLSWVGKSFDEVVQDVLDESQKSLPKGDLAILLLDEDQQCLRVRQRGGYSSSVEGMRISLEHGISGRCARSSEVQVVDDVTLEDDYIPGVPGARSQIAIPLVAEGAVIGVLSAESKSVAAYGYSDLLLLSVIARQVAAVLHASRLRDEVQWLAISDPLTGLFNRRYFEQQLAEAVGRAKRYGERLALAVLDLDHFKAINDRYGHPTGDRVLIRAAKALKSTARDSDVVARVGGEEFAVLLHHGSRSGAVAACNRMRHLLEAVEVEVGPDEMLGVTTSVGLALFPEHGEDPPRLFMAADQALYQAKRRGRSRVVVLGQSRASEQADVQGPGGSRDGSRDRRRQEAPSLFKTSARDLFGRVRRWPSPSR